MTTVPPQHYPAMDGKPPQCFFYDTCGREVINENSHDICSDDQHCDKSFKIVITLGV